MSGGRPRAFDRDAAIDIAVELFWRRGFVSTSVADLCRAMGIHAPSFYAAFTSKDALFLEAVARFNAIHAPPIWEGLDSAASAREGVESVLLKLAEDYADRSHPPGCLVILSWLGGEEHAGLADFVAANRAEAIDRFRRRLQRAVDEGELPSALDAESLGRLFGTLQQGMAIQGRDGVPVEALKAMVRTAMRGWPLLVGV